MSATDFTITIPADLVRQAAHKALLGEGKYGSEPSFLTSAFLQVVKDCSPQVDAAIRQSLLGLLASTDFRAKLDKSIGDAMLEGAAEQAKQFGRKRAKVATEQLPFAAGEGR